MVRTVPKHTISRIMHHQFQTLTINTPLGSMQAIADGRALYLLEFADNPRLSQKRAKLFAYTQATLVHQGNPILEQIRTELDCYFQGSLQLFTTPVALYGSSFQQHVWQQLQTITYGTTQSYSQLAACIEKPSGCRAVAQANAANRLAIIVPCHRIITKSGMIGGYSGGINRKEWLLKHEQKMV